MTTSLTLKALDGEHYVYPGHPLVVAICIMTVFENQAKASEHNQYNDPAALACVDIPGAGSSAYEGLAACRKIAQGETIDSVIDWCRQNWIQQIQHGSLKDRIQEGQDQADRLEHKFRALAFKWS